MLEPITIFEKRCTACPEGTPPKPLSQFYKTTRGGLMSVCKPCHNARSKKWWATTTLEQRRQYAQNQATNNPQSRKEIDRRNYLKRKDQGVFSDPDYRAGRRAYHKKYRDGLKQRTFEAYGGVFCACCGESAIEFLTLDHLHNDGAEDRRKMGRGASQLIYARLRNEGYPPGYQVLCFSCNAGRHIAGGTCPHQTAITHLWVEFIEYAKAA